MYPHLTTLAPRPSDVAAAHNGHPSAQPHVHAVADGEPSIHSITAKAPTNGSNGLRGKKPALDGGQGNGAVGVGAHDDVGAEHG